VRLKFSILLLFTVFSFFASGQTETKTSKKGNVYIIWGWNRAAYTNSDLRLKGTNYDFTLNNLVAHDRQSPFSAHDYLNLGRITIPQTNLRIGYFISDRWCISFGDDHMKYVMDRDQIVNVTGSIQNSGTEYDGVYNQTPMMMKEDFLKFEHTDGLNYLNIELRRHWMLLSETKSQFPKLRINAITGLGAGVLLPKTNATLLSQAQHDAYHLSGAGTAAVLGLNFTFYKWFFLQTELKGGYINMPDIRTTANKADRASQQFFFTQFNTCFGFAVPLVKQ
jgi:hypothetical protein